MYYLRQSAHCTLAFQVNSVEVNEFLVADLQNLYCHQSDEFLTKDTKVLDSRTLHDVLYEFLESVVNWST